jgi:hypothetical protein
MGLAAKRFGSTNGRPTRFRFIGAFKVRPLFQKDRNILRYSIYTPMGGCHETGLEVLLPESPRAIVRRWSQA